MSVLPLVFPDNMSCFSRGSYKVMMVIVIMKMNEDGGGPGNDDNLDNAVTNDY